MAINKTLYVRDEDIPVWDKAKEIVGDKMSALVTSYLKEFVAEKAAAASGNKRIVLSFRDSGKLPRTVAFHGRWLIPPEELWAEETDLPWDNIWALALTAKGNVAVFDLREGRRDEAGVYNWGKFEVFQSFEAACECSNAPTELIALAMGRMGIDIEELDI